MVPGGPILGRLPYVRRAAPGRNGTLSDRGNSVHLIRIVLSDAMEVDRCAVAGVKQIVGDVHLDSVAPVRDNGRTWETAVKSIDCAWKAIRGRRDLFESKVVLPRSVCLW